MAGMHDVHPLVEVFDAVPDAIVVADSDGRIVVVNGQAEQLFGWGRGALVGQQVELLLPERYRAAHRPARSGFVAAAQRRPMGAGRNLLGLRRDGSEVPVEVSLNAIHVDGAVQVVAAVRDVTERRSFEADLRSKEERLLRLALHDPLTGLANRSLLVDRIEQARAVARRHPTWISLLYLDLDRFKLINDSLGHDAGDKLLQQVAARLRSAVRPSDTAARLGGDEFAVCCTDLGPDEEVAASTAVGIGERVLEAVRGSYRLPPGRVYVDASVGLTLSPGSACSPQALLRDADTAMYRAKELGRGRLELFDADLRSHLLDRLDLESRLRSALAQGRLLLWYQPIVELDGCRVVGCEALLRWLHPVRGLLAPKEFLPVAEETGMIQPIGGWVIEQACRDLPALRRLYGNEGLTVAVNVSSRQMQRADLASFVTAVLRNAGLQPACLHLELTEHAFLDLAESLPDQLLALDRAGIGVGLDDFGTGYGSLSHLRRLPLRFIKLDQSFVAGIGDHPEDRAVASAVVQLGEALGMRVIAEGVETQEQVDCLARLGCKSAQGYLFGRPRPLAGGEGSSD